METPEQEEADKRAFLTEMGRRIKLSMQEIGLSETKFSWKAEMHETLLRRWIKGTTNPTATGLARLATALGVSVDYLLQLTDDPTPAAKRGEEESSGATPLPSPERRQGPPADELGPIGQEPGARGSSPAAPRRRSSD